MNTEASTYMKKKLEQVLSTVYECSCTINRLRQLSGGASAETWLLDAQLGSPAERSEFILRRSSVDQGERMSTSVTKSTEASVQKLLKPEGILVPEIIYELTNDDGLGDGYLMRRLNGETRPRKILHDEKFAHARNNLTGQCAGQLARIHAADITPMSHLLLDQSATPQLDSLENLYRSFQQDLPVFEYAIRWLRENKPNQSRYTLVHGDFRNGNLMVDVQGLCGILDWELTHLGDPMEDLGWLCVNSWRFGHSDKPVGGFGLKDELFDGYEQHSGVRVDADSVTYWQAFGTLRWGIICLYQTFTHLTRQNRSVELAAIGRRVSETEIDLLNLIA